MSLHQLIYQSQSLVPFSPLDLDKLLEKSRHFNQQHGITGLLLYTPDGRFLQVLEGEREAVRGLYYQCIAHDPRHYNCLVLNEGVCQARTFSEWSMAFRPAQAQVLRRLLAPVPAQSAALLVPRPHTRPELLVLLWEFLQPPEPALASR
ncbi:MAG: BLUF domain-containing protein [Bacteroidota bacterium]|nr:BLUF domain-containing protein [Bacteroidota bacterium]